VPLVVPEVNAEDIKNNKGIISNPNCSTIQMVVALGPIYKLSKIKRIIASTYQAASGAGQSACDELYNQTAEFLDGKDLTIKALSKRIAFNVIPQIGGFAELDYTSEEWKLVHETHKILHDDDIKYQLLPFVCRLRPDTVSLFILKLKNLYQLKRSERL